MRAQKADGYSQINPRHGAANQKKQIVTLTVATVRIAAAA